MDALGRGLPLSTEVGAPRQDRFVGIFYFLWLGNWTPLKNGPYDISKILAADSDALQKPDSPLWGPENTWHFWGESIWGYYHSKDPWVLRRHAHLLADAGVDTLIFDATNGFTYREVYMDLCRVFTQVRNEGGTTPQIAFMVNTAAGATAMELYHDLYKPGLFSDLWFQWQNKPLMICDPDQVNDELRNFFSLRKAHWPNEMKNTPYAWHWEATYPQPYGFTENPRQAEQVSVSVAQNLRASDGRVTLMSRGDARGRSFHRRKQRIHCDSVDWGHNMQEQWKRALKLDPSFIMVTGWNEWIAGRYSSPDEPIWFCDQYNQEFSRDIEPAKASHGDNYYMQLISNIRKFKGAPPLPHATPPQTIDISGPFSQWSNVDPVFTDPTGETQPRDFPGVDFLHYINTTGQNDFQVMKVTRDQENIYCYVETHEPISPPGKPGWMVLLLNTDGNDGTGWEGYDFIVNRIPGEGSRLMVERYAKGFILPPFLSCNPRCMPLVSCRADTWSWTPIESATCIFRIEENKMHLRIKRRSLFLPEDDNRLSLDFKWTDNLQEPENPLDFYISGDVAPSGRFRYRYSVK